MIDDIPLDHPASEAGHAKPRAPRSVGPESEVRGGPEAPEEALPEPPKP